MEPVEIILAQLSELKADVREGMHGIHQRLDSMGERQAEVETAVGIHWILWSVVGALVLVALPIVVEAFR